jgi:hypothetical protein
MSCSCVKVANIVFSIDKYNRNNKYLQDFLQIVDKLPNDMECMLTINDRGTSTRVSNKNTEYLTKQEVLDMLSLIRA